MRFVVLIWLCSRSNIKMQCTREHLMRTNKYPPLRASVDCTEDSGYRVSRQVLTTHWVHQY